MMYEMKNLFSPSDQGERTDNAFLTAAVSITSKHRDGHTPVVTSEGVKDELRPSGPSDSLLHILHWGPERMWLTEIQQVTQSSALWGQG